MANKQLVAVLECILEDINKDQEIGFVSLENSCNQEVKNSLILIAIIKPVADPGRKGVRSPHSRGIFYLYNSCSAE